MGTLRQIRKERGLTQEELAAKADISPVTLVYAERVLENKPGRPGRKAPSLSTLTKIAGALGVEVHDLMPHPEDPYTEMSSERLAEEGVKIRQQLGDAIEAEDWERVQELHLRGERIGRELDKLNPPLCTIHLTPDKKPKVRFLRTPSEDEKHALAQRLREYAETPDLLLQAGV